MKWYEHVEMHAQIPILKTFTWPSWMPVIFIQSDIRFIPKHERFYFIGLLTGWGFLDYVCVWVHIWVLEHSPKGGQPSLSAGWGVRAWQDPSIPGTKRINISVNPAILCLSPSSPSGLAEVIIPGIALHQHISCTEANPYKQNRGGEKVSYTLHSGIFREVSFMW